MTAKIHFQSLINKLTDTEIFKQGLDLAASLGLPITSWRTGDPTRTTFVHVAQVLAAFEEIHAGHVASSFLSTAQGVWKKIVAKETYNVDAEEASYAEPTVTLSNGGGGFYEIEAGDLTFRASSIDKTFTNTDGGSLIAGGTLTLQLSADEPGASSSVAMNDIDELVTTLLGVTVASSTAAVARDEQSEAEIEAQCLASTGALSPNGPADAYEFVARSSALTGVSNVTRARSSGDTATGAVTVYIAGASGGVDGATVSAVQDAIEQWATPLSHTPTVISASTTAIDYTATVFLSIGAGLTEGDAADDVETALQALHSSIDVGGDGGEIALSLILHAIHSKFLKQDGSSYVTKVVMSEPTLAATLAANEIPVLGTVAITVVLV